jgi:hypothetical protein
VTHHTIAIQHVRQVLRAQRRGVATAPLLRAPVSRLP